MDKILTNDQIDIINRNLEHLHTAYASGDSQFVREYLLVKIDELTEQWYEHGEAIQEEQEIKYDEAQGLLRLVAKEYGLPEAYIIMHDPVRLLTPTCTYTMRGTNSIWRYEEIGSGYKNIILN